MDMNKEQYFQYIEWNEKLEERAINVLLEKEKIEKNVVLKYDEIQKIEFFEDHVYIELVFYRRCGCCPDDTYEYRYPSDYLFHDDWKEQFKQEIEEEKETQKRIQEEKEKKAKEVQKQREWIEYERLKEKFETEKKESELKTFIIVFYNRFACQTQTYKVKAKNEFRAGRLFYQKYNRKSYHSCIETIDEV